MKPTRLRLVESTEKRPVAAAGRRPNATYRIREHLTEQEMARLLAALKRKRHGQRDWLIGLLIYPHGLRVSEARDLRWERHRPEQRHYPCAPAQGRKPALGPRALVLSEMPFAPPQ